ALVLFVVAVLGSGAGICVHLGLAGRSSAAERLPAAGQRVAERQFIALVEQERGGREARRDETHLIGKIVGVAKDGKSITIQTPPVNRDEEPGKRQIKLTDKTELKFFGVGPGGARLSAGMMAHLWTVAAGKDVAAKIYLGDGRGRDGSIQPDFSGKLIGISK